MLWNAERTKYYVEYQQYIFSNFDVKDFEVVSGRIQSHNVMIIFRYKYTRVYLNSSNCS